MLSSKYILVAFTLLAQLGSVSAGESGLEARQQDTCSTYSDCSYCPLGYRCCRRGSETCGCVELGSGNWDLRCT
ncbi:hypothetical protein BDV18DRAFT_129138 [Aspergillus unguis]